MSESLDDAEQIAALRLERNVMLGRMDRIDEELATIALRQIARTFTKTSQKGSSR